MKIAKRLTIVGSMLGALGILVAFGNGDGESSGKAEIEFFNLLFVKLSETKLSIYVTQKNF